MVNGVGGGLVNELRLPQVLLYLMESVVATVVEVVVVMSVLL